MNSVFTRRRVAVLILAVMVSLAHWWLAQFLPEVRIGEGSTERMPQRIEVTYVRELAQAAPPAAPVVVARRAAARPAPAAKKPAPAASAASAPELPADPPASALAADATSVAMADPPPRPEPAPTEPALPEPEAPGADVAAAPDASASAAAAFEWPASTRLSYRLSGNYRGEVTGNAQVEWARAGTRYQVHLDVWVGAQAAPLVARRMSSDGEITDEGLAPRRYDEETRALFRELRRRTIVFDGTRVLLPNGKQIEALPGLQDAASQFVQLTWLFTTRPELLKVGQRIEVPLALPTRVDRLAYDVVEAVTLDTPVGALNTFHLRPRLELRQNRDLVADVWFAPTLQYLPVRLLIRQDEATYIDLMLDHAPLQADSAPRAGSAPR